MSDIIIKFIAAGSYREVQATKKTMVINSNAVGHQHQHESKPEPAISQRSS